MAIVTSKYVPGVDGQPGKSVDVVVGVGTTVAQDSTYLGDGDSSYYGVYFDVESGEFKNCGTGYTPQGITVDATEEIQYAWMLQVAAKKAAGQAKAAAIRLQQDALDARYEAATPRKGKTVQVVRGRKIPKGTVAEVAWYGESQYGGYRVALLIDGEKVYTNASNVEVVQAEAVAA
jgi:hypothetical protein